mmetsp:Transcript_116734/g.308400  ORF Transcript_116734/g.308400 Transcript_116734/m.308400 type:complete len:232 (-) Transcript_116734:484-1179(-)
MTMEIPRPRRVHLEPDHCPSAWAEIVGVLAKRLVIDALAHDLRHISERRVNLVQRGKLLRRPCPFSTASAQDPEVHAVRVESVGLAVAVASGVILDHNVVHLADIHREVVVFFSDLVSVDVEVQRCECRRVAAHPRPPPQEPPQVLGVSCRVAIVLGPVPRATNGHCEVVHRGHAVVRRCVVHALLRAEHVECPLDKAVVWNRGDRGVPRVESFDCLLEIEGEVVVVPRGC